MKSTTEYSKIIAGTMTWGKWGKRLSTDEMVQLMNTCVDLGITTFDHADIYGDYTTESDFGEAFSKSGLKREKVQFIGKCGIQFKAETRNNKVKHYDYSSTYIIWSVEQSLKKLKTEYLDLLLLHRPSPLMNASEIFEAISKLKQEGKIKQFGVSNFTPSQIKLLETTVKVEGNQVECSLTHNDAMEDGTLDDCVVHDRLAMAWSPLGTYFRKSSDQTKRIQKTLEQLKAKYDATEDQILLAWILRHPANIYPVVGTATPERLALAMNALAIQIDLEDWFLLLEASNGSEVA
ncbi:aldo/keto reductase [Maribacter litopenaei]|uniref:Aldo/keto reductase n=1 Tax=Maribacter litopenaei TaxID=2976127 RepID=A0ABY5Y7E5_9FLAO|nr:aldo/keto reductase [Maribacter litopenaei]UWX54814.1 aldo/keto reductase [Maribacter litopenaei]